MRASIFYGTLQSGYLELNACGNIGSETGGAFYTIKSPPHTLSAWPAESSEAKKATTLATSSGTSTLPNEIRLTRARILRSFDAEGNPMNEDEALRLLAATPSAFATALYRLTHGSGGPTSEIRTTTPLVPRINSSSRSKSSSASPTAYPRCGHDPAYRPLVGARLAPSANPDTVRRRASPRNSGTNQARRTSLLAHIADHRGCRLSASRRPIRLGSCCRWAEPATNARLLTWPRATARERPHQVALPSGRRGGKDPAHRTKRRLRAGEPVDRDQWPMWPSRRQSRADDSHPSGGARGVSDDREQRRADLGKPIGPRGSAHPSPLTSPHRTLSE